MPYLRISSTSKDLWKDLRNLQVFHNDHPSKKNTLDKPLFNVVVVFQLNAIVWEISQLLGLLQIFFL